MNLNELNFHKEYNHNSKEKIDDALKKARLNRIKRAQKSINDFNNLAPKISLPIISKESVLKIKSNTIDILEEKNDFFDKIVKYWLMKRYSRYGVPLLRRLQDSKALKINSNNNNHKTTSLPNQTHLNISNDSRRDATTNEIDYDKMKSSLENFKKVRQDMDKIRTLLGLISERERLKLDQIKILHVESVYEINQFNGIFLPKLVGALCKLDVNNFFLEPVDPNIAPNYYEEIKEPMCFKKIQEKINKLDYKSFSQFESDFNLIIRNCCQYNPKNTIHYKAAVKLKEKVN